MEAVQKARVRLSTLNPSAEGEDSPTPSETKPVASTPEQEDKNENFLLVKADYKLYKINYDDLLYIEGQHEYVSFYTKEKRITALYALKTLEEILPANRFIRVHKSYIVSINHIREIEQLSVSIDDVKIPVGGIYREALLKRLGANN